MYLNNLKLLPKEREEKLIEHGFRLVTVADGSVFTPFYDRMNEDWSTPMSFMAMIAWRVPLTFYYKIIEDYLVLAGWDTLDGRMTMLPLIGHYEEEAVARVFTQVIEEMTAMGFPVCILDMREWMQPYYDKIPGTQWMKTDCDAYYDYVYEGESFDAFSGKSGQNLRYFLKNYNSEVREITTDDVGTITDFVRANWCVMTECDSCNFGCPVNCLEQVIPNLKELHGFGIMVLIDGELAGYCIGSRFGRVAVLHFQNTAGNYKGLGVFMYRECRRRFLSDVERISLGEDMGMPGIRTFKSRLAPHQWIPRFEYLLVSH